MKFISTSWSPNMVTVGDALLDFHELSKEEFQAYAYGAYSCLNQRNLAEIFGLDYNPEHVQLRYGDILLVIHLKGGKLSPDANKIPEHVIVEYYCYRVLKKDNAHVVNEKEEILIEEE